MYQLGIGGTNKIEKKDKMNKGRNYDLYATADYRKFNFFSRAAYQVRDTSSFLAISTSLCNLVPRAPKAREKRPGDEVAPCDPHIIYR